MNTIKTKINGIVSIDLDHGFDCYIGNALVQNFRSYIAARYFQTTHNDKVAQIMKDNIGTPRKQRKAVPPLCTIKYYTI